MTNKKKYELTRAIFHIGCSLILVWTFNYVKPVIIIAIGFFSILLVEIIRIKFFKINDFITTNKYSFWSKIVRRGEKRNFSAILTASFAFLIISWLPLNLLKTAILVNAFADPAARMFGIKWGKKKILNTKNSFVGSSAFFITAFSVCIIFAIPVYQSLITAAAGTMAELMPDKKPFWSDNLRIPVFVGLVLWILI